MKQFFRDLLSGSNETSSKRFAALITLANVLVLAYLAAWKNNWLTPEYMFNALCLIVGGGLGLTVVEKIFGKKTDTTTTTASMTTTTIAPSKPDAPQPEVDSTDAPDQP
jgi:hypothetical protein